MNPKTSGDAPEQGKNDGALEKLAHLIDPSGREISDAELSDPGTNADSPSPKPVSTPAERKAPDDKSASGG